MKYKSTNNTVEMVADAIRRNLAAIRSIQSQAKDATMEDVAQKYLIDTLGYSDVQAKEVVAELQAGLDQYAQQRQIVEADSAAIETSIRTSIETYNPEERTAILVNTLTALQISQNPEINAAEQSVINASLSDEALIQAIAAALDTLPSDSVAASLIDAIDAETAAFIDQVRDLMSDDFRLATALQLYLMQKQGQIKLTEGDAPQMSPQMIGALTGASIDALNATADLKAGRIDLKTWQRILKYVVGAIFIIGFCILSACAIISINMMLMDVLLSVFGVGLLGSAICIIAMAVFTFKACDIHEKGFDYVVEKFSVIYDKVITKLTEWTKAVRDKVAELLNRRKKTSNEADAQRATEAPTETAAGTTETDLPADAALA